MPNVSVTMRCPRCGGDQIKMPVIQAPEGYVFDSTLVLVTCSECGHRPKMSEATVVYEDDSWDEWEPDDPCPKCSGTVEWVLFPPEQRMPTWPEGYWRCSSCGAHPTIAVA